MAQEHPLALTENEAYGAGFEGLAVRIRARNRVMSLRNNYSLPFCIFHCISFLVIPTYSF